MIGTPLVGVAVLLVLLDDDAVRANVGERDVFIGHCGDGVCSFSHDTFLLNIALFVTVVLTASRTIASSRCISTGSGGTYSTVRWEKYHCHLGLALRDTRFGAFVQYYQVA